MRRLVPLLCLAACAGDAPRAESPRLAPVAARMAVAPTEPPLGAPSVEPVPTARATSSAPAAPSSGFLVDSTGPSLAERSALFLELGARAPRAWGEDLPGVERSVAGAGPRLALTFDACDARGYDAELVAWLRSEGV
ncbi:MAG: hypothetical protein IT373_29350, partial [Polyangiaceae bacterium]|nr:hypothetical protein [Polyangiaceae bacterium]